MNSVRQYLIYNISNAGHDTTASAITWCLYLLAAHPQFQSKAREEVDQLLEGRDSDEILWYYN